MVMKIYDDEDDDCDEGESHAEPMAGEYWPLHYTGVAALWFANSKHIKSWGEGQGVTEITWHKSSKLSLVNRKLKTDRFFCAVFRP